MQEMRTDPGSPALRASSERVTKAYALVFIALVVGHAALTLAAPPAVALLPPHPDAGLLDRLFPGVPPTWVAVRLALVAALVAITAMTAHRIPERLAKLSTTVRPWIVPGKHAARLALAAAALHVMIAPWASALPRFGQLLYIGWLAVPALVLAVAGRDRGRASPAAARGPAWLALAAIVAGWAALRVPALWHSPLLATPADSIVPFDGVRRTLEASFDLLTGQQRPGFTSMLSVLQGPILLGTAPAELTPQVLQAFQVFWICVNAGLIGWIAAALLGRGSAPVAVAAYLFAPFTAATTLLLGAIFIGALIPGLLLVCWIRVVRDRRCWALVGFGALVGVSTTHPSLPLVALAASAALTLALWRNPPPLAVSGTAALSLLAAALPGMPSLDALMKLPVTYAHASQMWAGIEAVGLGLVPSAATEFQIGLGDPGRWDMVLGTLLASWATPRTALRLWGDAMFEPIGAGLVAIGVGTALARGRSARTARWLLLLMFVCAVPGFISSYDRPSLVRPLCMPFAFALLAALGYMRLEAALQWGRGLAIAFVLAIIAAGAWLFDVVQPRILAQSSVSIAIAAIDAGEVCPAATLLRPARNDIQQVEFFTAHLPRCRADSAAVQQPDSGWLAGLDRAGVLFWSPGLEEESNVAQRICAVHPEVQLWTIYDPAGLARVFAAARRDARWSPVGEVTPLGCGVELETDATRAAAALTEARRLQVTGDRAAAVQQLRTVAQSTFTQAPLYLALAEQLAGEPNSPVELREAVYWARRAVHVHDWRDAGSIGVLARLQQAAGRADEAEATLRRGLVEARGRDDERAARALQAALGALGGSPTAP